MSNEVLDLLAALRDGAMNLDRVAQKFRGRQWPRTGSPRPATFEELAARELDDPDPYVPGSFDDVAAAFHRGDISQEQYRVLADAVAESMRAQDRRDAEESPGLA